MCAAGNCVTNQMIPCPGNGINSNVETVTASLAKNSQRLDAVMAGLETLTGSGDKKGDLGEAAASIRKLADNLDKRTDEISTGLLHFSNSG